MTFEDFLKHKRSEPYQGKYVLYSPEKQTVLAYAVSAEILQANPAVNANPSACIGFVPITRIPFFKIQ
jgi:hypothetical protein